MGEYVKTYHLMELFKYGTASSRELSRSTEFWSEYYFHNISFYEGNKNLLENMRSIHSITGLEALIESDKIRNQVNEPMSPVKIRKKSAILNVESNLTPVSNNSMLKSHIYERDGDLSKMGLKAASLNDIIRFQSYMGYDLKNICMVCDEIREMYGMPRKLAREVFRETEGEFCVRGYGRIEELRGLRGVNLEDKIAKFKKRLHYNHMSSGNPENFRQPTSQIPKQVETGGREISEFEISPISCSDSRVASDILNSNLYSEQS